MNVTILSKCRPRLMIGSILATGLACLLPTSAMAQQADSAPPEEEVFSGDIIVTAHKRTERLQDVATAVSVVSGQDLERNAINKIEDLTTLVPSLAFTSGAGEDTSSARIRGLGTQVFSVGVEPSISYVVDGVVLSRELQGLGDLFDIERIEVLRGPQGTLFGKNASAGVISVVTKAPSKSFSVDAFGLLTNDNERQIKLGVSGPLSDTVGFRLSGYYNQRDGHIVNVFDNSRISGENAYGFRGKLVFAPTDRLTLTAIGDYRYSNSSCCAITARALTSLSTPQFIAPVIASPSNRATNVNAPPFGRGEQYGGSVQIDYALDKATITSISAYRYYDFATDQDIDGTPFTFVPVGVSAAYLQLNRNFGITRSKTWTQELRIASSGKNRFDYVVGAFFFDSVLDRDFDRLAQVCLVGQSLPTRPAGSDCGTFGRNLPAGFTAKVNSRSYAIFADGTWNVAGPLSVIGGVRFNYEQLGYTFSVFNTAAAAVPVTSRFTGARDVDDAVFTGRGGLKLKITEDSNVFATYSRGYKTFAFDLTTSFTPAIAALQPITPETSNSYELSFKGNLLGRHLTLNATGFLTDYDGFQVQAFDTQAAVFRLLNAGSVRTYGLEIEAVIRPSRRLTISTGFTYANTRVRSFVGGPCYAGQPVVNTTPGGGAPLVCASNGTAAAGDNTQNLAGGRLPNAPDFRISVNSRYEVPLPSLPFDGFIQGSVVTQSDSQFALNQNPGSIQDGYSVVNAAIGFASREKGYEVQLFVKNLTDTNYAASIFEAAVNNSPAGNFSQIIPRGASRYFGGSVRLSF